MASLALFLEAAIRTSGILLRDLLEFRFFSSSSTDSPARLEIQSSELPVLLVKSGRHQEISPLPSRKASHYVVHIVLQKIIWKAQKKICRHQPPTLF